MLRATAMLNVGMLTYRTWLAAMLPPPSVCAREVTTWSVAYAWVRSIQPWPQSYILITQEPEKIYLLIGI